MDRIRSREAESEAEGQEQRSRIRSRETGTEAVKQRQKQALACFQRQSIIEYRVCIRTKNRIEIENRMWDKHELRENCRTFITVV